MRRRKFVLVVTACSVLATACSAPAAGHSTAGHSTAGHATAGRGAAAAVAGSTTSASPVASPTAFGTSEATATGSPTPTTAPTAAGKPTSDVGATTSPESVHAATESPAGTADAGSTRATSAATAPTISTTVIQTAGVKAAAAVATTAGYEVSIAVADTRTGTLYGTANAGQEFASESVMKVFIATRLLLTHQMTGSTAATAYEMITESDDDSADALYGLVGGDQVLPWIAAHYGIADLGSPPTRGGWWSNTHITAAGMAIFYAKVKADKAAWPWLSNAMGHATTDGSDGTYQFFGLKQVDADAAVKQGWGQDDDDWEASSDFNTTGYVDSGRYAVVILLKGPPSEYNTGMPAMLTSVATELEARRVIGGSG